MKKFYLATPVMLSLFAAAPAFADVGEALEMIADGGDYVVTNQPTADAGTYAVTNTQTADGGDYVVTNQQG